LIISINGASRRSKPCATIGTVSEKDHALFGVKLSVHHADKSPEFLSANCGSLKLPYTFTT
jgi:hypothetical protein